MDYNVKVLLEKYWAAETTLEEEQWLYEYFKRADISEELVPYKALFEYCDTQKKNYMKQTLKILLSENVKPSATRMSTYRFFPYALRWVATLLLLVVASF
ncbi:MAG TPA: hypothetical protein ENJ45_05305, partial [Phaeodactylibacter sp.]|nr:hypothetical protein [Phaeodactylibacter sp.]